MAWAPLGWKASGFSEIEPFPSAVLKHHYPDVPNHGDMTTLPAKITTGEVEAPDLLCGGTPCQAFSVAGLRQSLDDARGNLTLTFCEIADAIDAKREQAGQRASIIFWENVPGVLNTKDNAFGCFLGALAGEDDALVAPGGRWANAGFVDGPQRAVAWRVLDAQYFGVAQRRRRVFVVASARADFDPAAVLFEFEGVRRDTAPSREAWQKTAGTISSRTTGGGGLGTDFECAGKLQPVAARMVAFGEYVDDGTASTMKMRDYKDATDLVSYGIPGNWIGRAPENGGNSTQFMEELAPCLTGADKHGVAQPISINSTEVCHAIGANSNATGAVAIGTDCFNGSITGDVAATMGTMGSSVNASGPTVMQAMRVRRLTPVECERLQGFPDNYTNIPWRKADQSPDGPRYKALGNSWAVPVVRWIGGRIVRSLA